MTEIVDPDSKECKASEKYKASTTFDRKVTSIVKELSRRMKEYTGKICNEQVPLHGLRRTYATMLYEEGTSLEIISRLLRHSNLEETVKYIDTKAIDETLKREVRKVDGVQNKRKAKKSHADREDIFVTRTSTVREITTTDLINLIFNFGKMS